MTMELNREQIIKALECCVVNSNCNGCPFWEGYVTHRNCLQTACKNALALIKELTEDNERLTRLANLRQRDLDNANDLLFKAEDEVARLRAENKARLSIEKQKYMLKSDGRIEMIPTVESVRADTVRKMQEELKKIFSALCKGEMGDLYRIIDQIAKEMLECKE